MGIIPRNDPARAAAEQTKLDKAQQIANLAAQRDRDEGAALALRLGKPVTDVQGEDQ